ncbi:MAG: hypothetical protein GVY06_06075 [Alphaproteobacteria bacterium]|nr:hypothetical protein [Alphaproteobacteria bacterium]
MVWCAGGSSDLAQWLFEEFGVSLDQTTVSRELKAMGYAKLSARPRHRAQNAHAMADFKKLPGRDRPDPKGRGPRRRDRGVVPGRSAGGAE